MLSGLAAASARERAGLFRELLFQAAADQLAQLEDRGVGNRVEDLQPVFSPGKHVRLRERLQVPGHVGLSRAREFDERRHIKLTLEKSLKQPEPHGFSEYGKPSGHVLEGLIIQRKLFCHGTYRTGA